MATIIDELSAERAALEKEVFRLEELLAANPDWRVLRALESGLSAGIYRGPDLTAVNARRQVLHQRLASNRVFAAYQRLKEAAELMREAERADKLQARKSHATMGRHGSAEGASRREPFRTRVKVKIHAGLPGGADAAPGTPRTSRDDLTRIRGIDRELAARLHGLGVTTWDEIAAWRREDVRALTAALGLDGRISRENWIEQAAALTLRRPPPPEAPPAHAPIPGSLGSAPETDAQAAVPPSPPLSVPVPAQVAIAPLSSEGSPPAQAPTPPPDDLTVISAIDSRTAAALQSAGITRFADIASWRVDDVAAVSVALGLGGRISREGWIEQAAILATGATTAHVRRRHLAPPLAPPTAFVRELRPDPSFRATLDAMMAKARTGGSADLEAEPALPAIEDAEPDTEPGPAPVVTGRDPETDQTFIQGGTDAARRQMPRDDAGSGVPSRVFATPAASALVAANDPGNPGNAFDRSELPQPTVEPEPAVEPDCLVAGAEPENPTLKPDTEPAVPAASPLQSPIAAHVPPPGEELAGAAEEEAASSTARRDDYDLIATGFENGKRAAPLPAPLELAADRHIDVGSDPRDEFPASVHAASVPQDSSAPVPPAEPPSPQQVAAPVAPASVSALAEPARDSIADVPPPPVVDPAFADPEPSSTSGSQSGSWSGGPEVNPVPADSLAGSDVENDETVYAVAMDVEEAEVEIRPAVGHAVRAPVAGGVQITHDPIALAFEVEEASVEIVPREPSTGRAAAPAFGLAADPAKSAAKAVSEPTLRRFMRAFESR